MLHIDEPVHPVEDETVTGICHSWSQEILEYCSCLAIRCVLACKVQAKNKKKTCQDLPIFFATYRPLIVLTIILWLTHAMLCMLIVLPLHLLCVVVTIFLVVAVTFVIGLSFIRARMLIRGPVGRFCGNGSR